MNKIEMIRPLTFDELDCVAGVMMAFWTVGARELVITADANGSSVARMRSSAGRGIRSSQ